MTTPVPDPDAFAALLCDWCMEVAPGDRVGIMSTTLAEDVAVALHRAVLERDAWPYVALEPPGLAPDLYPHPFARHRAAPAPRPTQIPPPADPPGGRRGAERLRRTRRARKPHRARRCRSRGRGRRR